VRPLLHARIGPAPRLRLQAVTVAVGLGLLGTGLMAAGSATGAAVRPLVVVTDMEGGHPTPDVATPPPLGAAPAATPVPPDTSGGAPPPPITAR